MKNAKKHNWNRTELELVLNTTLRFYKIRDWNVIKDHLSKDIGVSNGSISALLIGFGKMSDGLEADALNGGFGSNWGSQTEDVFTHWAKENKLTKNELNRIFN